MIFMYMTGGASFLVAGAVGSLRQVQQGELVVWPHMGEIEDVYSLLLPKIFGFLSDHGLHFEGPFGVVAAPNGGVEVFLGVVSGLGG
jgi:hypothetical protein